MISYFSRELLGEKRAVSPEGYLICKDVPIARTGTMVYGPGELRDRRIGIIPAGPDGIIYAHRSPEDVFAQEVIDSFQGKPVVLTHPSGDVTPDNWNDLAVGVTMNVRRGMGTQDDLMLADLFIASKDAIPVVKAHPEDGGIREVSCGYDADYDQLHEPGHVRQYNIRGNHVALVESGRCGPRCAIGDSKTVEDKAMTLKERLKKLFAEKDESGFTAALAEVNEGPVTLTTDQLKTIAGLVTVRDAKDEHEKGCDCAKCKDRKTMDAIAKDVKDIGDKVNGLDERMKKVEDEKKEEAEKEDKETEGRLKEEAPPGSGDKAAKAKDSSFLADAWQETLSLSEAIAPGMKMPTMDAADNPKKTLDRMCDVRRTAVELGANRPELRQFIDGLLGGKEIKSLTCDQLRPIFKATGQYAMSANNRDGNNGNGTHKETPKPKMTLADLNKMNREFYASK